MILNRYKPVKLFAMFFALVISFAAGYGFRGVVPGAEDRDGEIRLAGYRFINPLLECEMSQSTSRFHELRPFKGEVQRVVDAHIAKSDARSIVVYFRDLNNGPWFSINEQERFTPASMMKVPFMIALLKRAETDGAFLQKKIRYEGGEDLEQYQHFKPKERLRPGSWYTVDDLIFRMIAYSDNNATKLLAGSDARTIINGMMAELNIPFDIGNAGEIITVRDYSAFFRILFNASYLNHAMSEKALGYLARTTFNQGIEARIPGDIPAATKFGEYSTERFGQTEYELHEVGIVYYPDHPYLLGIATKGRDHEPLPSVIADISRTVYQEVDRQQHPVVPFDPGAVAP